MSPPAAQKDPRSKPTSDSFQISVLVVVILSFLLSVTFAAMGIVVFQRIGSLFTDVQRLASYIHITIYILCPAACLSGIYAISFKKPKLISFYMSFVIGQTILSLIAGVLCLYVFYHAPTFSWNRAQCLAIAHDSFTQDICTRGALLKGVATAFLLVMWLVEFAIMFLGNVFLSQLYEEEMRMEMFDPKYYDNDAHNC